MSEATLATRVIRDGERIASQHVRAFRLHVRGADGSETVQELAQPLVRVGSRRGNDVVVDDATMSRIHFEIAADPLGFRLRDLDSKNGTVVDGYRAADIYLRPGSRIVAGRTELRFELSEREAEVVLSPRESFGPLFGKSAAMRELFAVLERVAPTDFTVLVEGETGTGKELVAAALHGASRRARGPLVVFDAAAAPEQLVESQLFGHERGAFTGATERRIGLAEEADGGTLFIDELGELPLRLQPKLLRVLEAREVCPVGGNVARAVDTRVVAATHRDLAAAVNQGAFRDDLYYRLAVVRVVVPPLRSRPDDIPLLLEHFVQARLASEPARARAIVDAVGRDDWQRLTTHPWPGNVRQLRNVVDVSLALAGDDEPVRFDPDAGAPRGPEPAGSSAGAAAPDFDRPFVAQRDQILAGFERAYLVGMLERHGGKLARAAAASGLDRAYFKRLLRKYR